MATKRPDPDSGRPYVQFNFLVDLGNGDTQSVDAGFQEISGIGMEVTVSEYRTGNYNENSVMKITGMNKSTDVTLKRGIICRVFIRKTQLHRCSLIAFSPTSKASIPRLKTASPLSNTASIQPPHPPRISITLPLGSASRSIPPGANPRNGSSCKTQHNSSGQGARAAAS